MATRALPTTRARRAAAEIFIFDPPNTILAIRMLITNGLGHIAYFIRRALRRDKHRGRDHTGPQKPRRTASARRSPPSHNALKRRLRRGDQIDSVVAGRMPRQELGQRWRGHASVGKRLLKAVRLGARAARRDGGSHEMRHDGAQTTS